MKDYAFVQVRYLRRYTRSPHKAMITFALSGFSRWYTFEILDNVCADPLNFSEVAAGHCLVCFRGVTITGGGKYALKTQYILLRGLKLDIIFDHLRLPL